jgi:hypothetical protein
MPKDRRENLPALQADTGDLNANTHNISMDIIQQTRAVFFGSLVAIGNQFRVMKSELPLGDFNLVMKREFDLNIRTTGHLIAAAAAVGKCTVMQELSDGVLEKLPTPTKPSNARRVPIRSTKEDGAQDAAEASFTESGAHRSANEQPLVTFKPKVAEALRERQAPADKRRCWGALRADGGQFVMYRLRAYKRRPTTN